MKRADYRCRNCGQLTEWIVSKAQDFPPYVQCRSCISCDTYRVYGEFNFDIASGKLGNAANKYENNIVYHPSKFGTFKGKRIK